MKYDTEEEAISAAKEKLNKDVFIDFDGNDFCDDDCLGWDGESRRCDCGNRRVYWETEKDSNGKFYAYPQVF